MAPAEIRRIVRHLCHNQLHTSLAYERRTRWKFLTPQFVIHESWLCKSYPEAKAFEHKSLRYRVSTATLPIPAHAHFRNLYDLWLVEDAGS